MSVLHTSRYVYMYAGMPILLLTDSNCQSNIKNMEKYVQNETTGI